MLLSVFQTLDNDPPVGCDLVGRKKLHKALMNYTVYWDRWRLEHRNIKKYNFCKFLFYDLRKETKKNDHEFFLGIAILRSTSWFCDD